MGGLGKALEANRFHPGPPGCLAVFLPVVYKDTAGRIQLIPRKQRLIDRRLRLDLLFLTGEYDPVHILQELHQYMQFYLNYNKSLYNRLYLCIYKNLRDFLQLIWDNLDSIQDYIHTKF